MRPSAGALAALEVAVAGAGGALAGLELVGIHRQAHAATRLPPLGAGLGEDPVQPLGLGLVPHLLAAGNDQCPDAVGDLATLEDPGRGPQVLDPPVGARADENDIDGDLADRVSRVSVPCSRARGGRPREPATGISARSGTRPVTSTVIAGFVPQVTCGTSVEASIRT